ncbi:MAG: HYR domain-containing protein [Anaeromyxobacteraceae bacterium]
MATKPARGALVALTSSFLALAACGGPPSEAEGALAPPPPDSALACDCSWHSAFDLCVTCCGDVGQAVCPSGGACKPGLVYNAAKAVCDNPPPACGCSWRSAFDLCVTCCGDVGQAICPTGDSCKPGLHYDGSTTHCEQACSWHQTVFGNCCGDVGQPICVSGDACKPGLHYDGSTTHCELPCSWHQSSFGNCCGDVDQVHCDPLSGDTCKPGLAVGVATCRDFRTPGETCGPDYPCKDGSSCALVVDASALKLECMLDKDSNVVGDPDACKAFYSADIATGAKNSGGTLNFGVGAQGSVGVAGAIETGVFYTEDERYGCYVTTCYGLETNVGIGVYGVVGESDKYEDFKGHSFVLNQLAGIEFVSYINSQGWNSKEDLGAGKAPVSASQAISIGLDIIPISVGAAECDTITQVVVGQDTASPPVALCHDVSMTPATGCTAAVSVNNGSYSPTAGVTITTSQSPAGPYQIGNTPVTLTATDSNGLTATCSATVTVLDGVPPVITCPANVRATNEAGRCDARVSFPEPVATDTCSAVAASATPASGSTFAVGTTTVKGLALDEYLNTASCSFTVTVVDAEAPGITAPPDMVVDATMPTGAVVSYPAFTATDNCAGLAVDAEPPSGSVFPIDPDPAGFTEVVGRATDAAGNVSTASFRVHVKGAREQLSDLLAFVETLRHHEGLEHRLLQAIRALDRGRTFQTCHTLGEIMEELGEQERERCPQEETAALLTAAGRIRDVLSCQTCREEEDEGLADAR